MGWILISEVTNGICWFGWYFPSRNGEPNGYSGVRKGIHWRPLGHHQRQPWWSPRQQVFIWFHDAGLKINAIKSVFCVQETEYLGYILTRGGIKPQPKKVQAILALNPPNNVKELWQFLGMVQYYWDMWQKRSEILAPVTDLVRECGETKTTKQIKTKKKPWRWESINQQAFDNMKATIAKEVVLAYPDFTKPFEIYTDASTMQLGSMITQGNRPIAFFSRKLYVMQTIQCYQNWALSHSWNLKRVSRNAKGANNQSLYRP